MYVVKYDASGNVLWAQGAGKGPKNDYGISCSTDLTGNIIVTGYFQSDTIRFGAFALANANTFIDMFVVKYDPNGNVLWAKRAGGTDSEFASGCSTDASGNIFVTGYFGSPSVTFGTFTLTNTNTSNADLYIVKYDPLGVVLWAQSVGGNSGNYSNACCTDANGNVFVTGYFTGASLIFGTYTLTNSGNEDVFILKYDANGNGVWAQGAGGAGSDYAFACAADANGNIALTGHFTSTSITFGTTTLTSAGSWDMYVAKYDAGGTALWAKSAGGTSIETGRGCSTDINGNIIVAGGFQSSSITFGSTTLNSNGAGMDIFIAKYDPNGNELWAQGASGTSSSTAYSCSIAPNGNIIATGVFNTASVTFGSTTLNNSSSNPGFSEVFLVRLDELTGTERPGLEQIAHIYPCPFQSTAVMRFSSRLTNADLVLYNLSGKEVKVLVNICSDHIVLWRGGLDAGIYFYRVLQGGRSIATGSLEIAD
jgi:hypothetical protein